jgi:hypothetical protein
MAINVRVETGPLSPLDWAKDVPKEQWKNLVIIRALHCRTHLPFDCRELLRYDQEARELEMWKVCGYADMDEFIRHGLRLDPMLVGWALEGLKALNPDQAAPFEAAIEAGRLLRAKAGAPEGNKNAKKENNSRDTGIVSPGKSDTATYIQARLERDGKTDKSKADLLTKVQNGEISAQKAAVEAGFRQQYIRINPDNAEQMAAQIRKHCNDEVIEKLAALLRPPGPVECAGAASSNNSVADPVMRLSQKLDRWRTATKEWATAAFALAAEFFEARQTHGTDKEFAFWLINNELDDFAGTDRAALIQIGSHPEVSADLLEEIGIQPPQPIWDEVERRLRIKHDDQNHQTGATV